METVRFISAAGGHLELSDAVVNRDESLRFRATLSLAELHASVGVYDDHPAGLAVLFDDLARDWRGFEGIREWFSLENEFLITCTSDRLGHVFASIELRNNWYAGPPPGSPGWNVRANLTIEAGALDGLARDLHSFLRA